MSSIQRIEWTRKDGSIGFHYRVTYKDASGKWRPKAFRKKAEATAFIERIGAEVANGTHVSGKVPTVTEGAEIWLRTCEHVGRHGHPPVEKHTLRTYKGHVKNHILPRLGGKKMSQITPPVARQFVNDLLTDLSRPMARKVLISAYSIFDECRLQGLVAVNPFDGIKIQVNAGRHEDEVEIPEKEDVKKILAYADEKTRDRQRHVAYAWTTRYRPMFHLIVHTGVRISEARGLPIDAVNLSEGKLRIYQRADDNGEIGPCKTPAAKRTLDLPPKVVEYLKDAIGNRTEGLVFPTGSGGPIAYSNLSNQIWIPMRKKLKIAPIGLHALRHFRASLLIEKGANPKEVQREMGHVDPAFTLRVYGHLFKDADERRRARTLEIAEEF